MKAYTDLEQSKKLAEFLPLESADMHYIIMDDDEDPQTIVGLGEYIGILPNIPCWSLASLLEQLDDEITDEEGNDYNLTIVKESLEYQLYYHDSWGRAEDIETDYYDDMVDACYEMILKLHELKML